MKRRTPLIILGVAAALCAVLAALRPAPAPGSPLYATCIVSHQAPTYRALQSPLFRAYYGAVTRLRLPLPVGRTVEVHEDGWKPGDPCVDGRAWDALHAPGPDPGSVRL